MEDEFDIWFEAESTPEDLRDIDMDEEETDGIDWRFLSK